MPLDPAPWYAVRRAGSTRPRTYRCPLCEGLLPALSEHLLVLPEGDPARRRHAHTACVLRARHAGRLPDRDEWRRAQGAAGGPLARLLAQLRRG